jgi:hypothetical protein
MEIGSNGFGKVAKDGQLSTSWLDPCIGVVVYDTQQNKALVGHFQGVLTPRHGTLNEFVEAARKEFPDTSQLKASVRGSHFWNDYGIEQKGHLVTEREHVLAALHNVGIPNIDVQWGAVDHISRIGYNASGRNIVEETREISR